MDVTRSNINELKSTILEVIQDCCFCAIDCEFTGLDLKESQHPLDTVQERYDKLRDGITDYLVLQVGLSFWKYDDTDAKYKVKNLNFYTFAGEDQKHRFWSQSSSLSFLVSHGFDLNKCVREGLSWLHPIEYERRKMMLREKHISELEDMVDLTREEIEKEIDNGIDIEKLHERPQSLNVIRGANSKFEEYIVNNWNYVDKWFKGGMKKEEIYLPACSDFIRIATYKHMERLFYNQQFAMESSRPEKNDSSTVGLKRIRLFRSESTPLERLAAKHKKEKLELEECFGFSFILKALSESRKPIVGHNSQRDLLHILSQFFIDLPSSYSEFQCICNEVFPMVFDTRYIVNTAMRNFFRYGCLKDIHVQLLKLKEQFPLPEICVDDEYSYGGSSREHEAGYDAWITGYIFAAVSQYLMPNKMGVFSKLTPKHENLTPFLNKIPFGNSLDIIAMDLEHVEKLAPRDDVYIIEWSPDVEGSHARSIMTLCGGYKKCGFGEGVLAFQPNNEQDCIKVLTSKKNLIRPCKLYKYEKARNSSEQKRSSESEQTVVKTSTGSNKERGSPTNRHSPPGRSSRRNNEVTKKRKCDSPEASTGGVTSPNKKIHSNTSDWTSVKNSKNRSSNNCPSQKLSTDMAHVVESVVQSGVGVGVSVGVSTRSTHCSSGNLFPESDW